MEPTPRAPAFFQEHLAKRWAEGCQHGPRLLKEIQELGYTGCFSYLAQFLARWRRKTPTLPVALETTMPTANVAPRVGATASLLLLLCRQISPMVAAALLGKLRSKMTTESHRWLIFLRTVALVSLNFLVSSVALLTLISRITK